jgi:NAD(P)-dependent dehydrogenase (short-subunit alcohol dehydrogenase family)
MPEVVVNTPQCQTAYNSSKAGVIMLTKSLASEWAKYNIRVNTIAPGYMKIGVAEKFFIEKNEMVKRWLSFIPMGRPGEPEELWWDSYIPCVKCFFLCDRWCIFNRWLLYNLVMIYKLYLIK